MHQRHVICAETGLRASCGPEVRQRIDCCACCSLRSASSSTFFRWRTPKRCSQKWILPDDAHIALAIFKEMEPSLTVKYQHILRLLERREDMWEVISELCVCVTGCDARPPRLYASRNSLLSCTAIRLLLWNCRWQATRSFGQSFWITRHMFLYTPLCGRCVGSLQVPNIWWPQLTETALCAFGATWSSQQLEVRLCWRNAPALLPTDGLSLSSGPLLDYCNPTSPRKTIQVYCSSAKLMARGLMSLHQIRNIRFLWGYSVWGAMFTYTTLNPSRSLSAFDTWTWFKQQAIWPLFKFDLHDNDTVFLFIK